MRRIGLGRILVVVTIIVLASAATAWAFQALPPGGQVNDDLAAGIDKTISVSGEDPTNADVVGGALTAGKPAVPWAIFRQGTSRQRPDLRALVCRRRMDDARQRHGRRALERDRRPSAARSTSTSSQDGEAPAIDFAGAGRTVPWATWYEKTTGAGLRQQQRLRQPLRQHGRCEPGQVDLRRSGPRHGWRQRAGSVAEHPHRSGCREPLGGRRLGRRPDQAWSVGHMAGDDDLARPGKDQIFVERPHRPGKRELRWDQAARRGRKRSRPRRSAASAGSRPASRASGPAAPIRA